VGDDGESGLDGGTIVAEGRMVPAGGGVSLDAQPAIITQKMTIAAARLGKGRVFIWEIEPGHNIRRKHHCAIQT
jgi:hypothetical protein